MIFGKGIHGVTVIIKSCLTGRAVWIYRGPSKNASQSAYWRACKYEVERFKRWSKHVARRKANIQRLLTDCTAGIDIAGTMTPEQKAAARRLASLSEDPAFNREFYDHVVEERRRMERDRKIRRKMRSRDSVGNRDYDKQEGEI